ncbi:MAG: hypothetical protein K0S99_1005 [Thermomicrobiales bacterium]|nr:hypothetical protein [Thermomicrobiales bacterium]
MEEARLGCPPRLTRRLLLTVSAAVVALTRAPARAQTPTDPPCARGFVHGLRHCAPDCPLLDPPGTTIGQGDFVVAPPSHLLAPEGTAEGTTGTETEAGVVPQRGSRRKRKKARLHRRSKQRRHQGRRHKHGGGGTDTVPTPTIPTTP